jgi:hypothetical protein
MGFYKAEKPMTSKELVWPAKESGIGYGGFLLDLTGAELQARAEAG